MDCQLRFNVGAFVMVRDERVFLCVHIDAKNENAAARLGFEHFKGVDEVQVTGWRIGSECHRYHRGERGKVKLVEAKRYAF